MVLICICARSMQYSSMPCDLILCNVFIIIYQLCMAMRAMQIHAKYEMFVLCDKTCDVR